MIEDDHTPSLPYAIVLAGTQLFVDAFPEFWIIKDQTLNGGTRAEYDDYTYVATKQPEAR